MTKFEELLNVLMDAVSEVSENRKSADTDEKRENETYFRSVYDEYENGKHITHSDKEYKNGKCVKNEGFDERKEISDKSTCKCNCDKECTNSNSIEDRVAKLEAELKRLAEENAKKDDELVRYKNKFKAITNILE